LTGEQQVALKGFLETAAAAHRTASAAMKQSAGLMRRMSALCDKYPEAGPAAPFVEHAELLEASALSLDSLAASTDLMIRAIGKL
jgi:hypothetical protein